MYTRLGAAAIVAALIIPFGGAVLGQSPDPGIAHAAVADADGADVGSVTWTQGAGTVTVEVSVHGLPPGFHGFHVHAVGECVAPFTSAGPHLNPGGVEPPRVMRRTSRSCSSTPTAPGRPPSARTGTPWWTSLARP